MPNPWDKYTQNGSSAGGSNNPWLKYQSQQPTYDPTQAIASGGPEDDTLTKLGHLATYLGGYLKQAVTHPIDTYNSTPSAFEIGRAVDARVQKSHDDLMNWYNNTPAKDLLPDFLSKVTDAASQGFSSAKSSGLGGVVSGIPNFFLDAGSAGAEALTGFKNDSGTARPGTPDELAQSTLTTLGNIAFGKVAGGITASLGGGAVADMGMQDVLKFANRTYVGKLGQTIAADAAGLTGGSLAQGATANLGDDDALGKTIATSLALLPASVLFAPFQVAGKNRELGTAKAGLGLASAEAFTNLAAARSIQIDANAPLKDIINKVSAVASADDLIDAAIAARVNSDNGYVLSGVTPEKYVELQAMSGRYLGDSAVNYQLHPNLEKGIAKYGMTLLNFASPFDRLAYHVTAKEGSQYKAEYLQDAVNQTGLLEQDIVRHGKNVRAEVKRMWDSGQVVSKTALDLANEANDRMNRGKDQISRTIEGSEVPSVDGRTWKRQGNNFTDGTSVYPSESPELANILGMEDPDANSLTTRMDIGAQDFKPQFSNIPQRPTYYYFHEPTGTALATGVELADGVKSFFEKTGYVPGEVVGLNGNDYNVRMVNNGQATIQPALGGKLERVPVGDLVRQNTGLTTQMFQGSNSRFRIGVLTPGSFYKSLFDDFIGRSVLKQSEFEKEKSRLEGLIVKRQGKNLDTTKQEGKLEKWLSQDPSDSFDSQFHNFLDMKGIDVKDRGTVATGFYKILQDQVKNTLKPEEKSAIDEIQNRLGDIYKTDNTLKTTNLFNQFQSAGLFLDDTSGGGFKIYDDVGTLLHSGSDLNEVKQFLVNSGRVKAVDLDGGGSGGVPSGVMNLGFNQSFNPQRGLFQRVSDDLFTGRISKYVTPAQEWFSRLDNRIGGTSLTEFSRALQDAQVVKRNWVAENVKPIMDYYTGAAKLQRQIDPSRYPLIIKAMETLDRGEIENGLMSRPMNSAELNFSQEARRVLGKTNYGIDEVAQLMQAMKDVGDSHKFKFGTSEWDTVTSAFLNTTTNPVFKDQTIQKLARDFFDVNKTQPLNKFSAYSVMRHIEAVMHPDANLTRDQFMTLNKFTGVEREAVQKLSDTLSKAGDVFQIDPHSKIKNYVPIIKQMYAAYDNVGDPAQLFAHEFRRWSMSADTLRTVRNPWDVVYRYIQAGVNVKSGFAEQLASARNQALGNVEALMTNPNTPPEVSKLGKVITDSVERYANNVRGIPDLDQSLAAVPGKFAKMLGMPVHDALNNLMYMSLLGGPRFGLGIRDMMGAIGFSYSAFGHKFTQDVLTGMLEKNHLTILRDKSILPKEKLADFVAPDSDTYMGTTDSKLTKATDFAFRMSGQEQMYNRVVSGVYKATQNMARGVLRDLSLGVLDKPTAYERLNLSIHPKAVVERFDRILQGQGSIIEDATDFLARENIRKVINIYGLNNNPIGWHSPFGRMFGALGSYSANALQTVTNMVSNGTRRERMQRGLRFAAFHGALIAIGAGLGVDLTNWMIDPIGLLPHAGPMLGAMGNAGKTTFQTITQSDDPVDAIGQLGSQLMPDITNGDVARVFLPYSRAAQDYINAFKNNDPWQTIGLKAQ